MKNNEIIKANRVSKKVVILCFIDTFSSFGCSVTFSSFSLKSSGLNGFMIGFRIGLGSNLGITALVPGPEEIEAPKTEKEIKKLASENATNKTEKAFLNDMFTDQQKADAEAEAANNA